MSKLNELLTKLKKAITTSQVSMHDFHSLIAIVETQGRALEFYADRRNWSDVPATPSPESDLIYYLYDDGNGTMAREAQAEVERLAEGLKES